MRLSDVLLISMSFFCACGAYDALLPRFRLARPVSVLAILMLLLMRRVQFEDAYFSVQAASVLLPLLLSIRMRAKQWGGALIVFLFGGMLAWKLSVSYPLFPEPGLLQAIVFVALACIYCHDIHAKLFAVSCAALCSGLYLCLQDVLLFGFGRVILGSNVLFDAQIVSVYVLMSVYCLFGSNSKQRAVQPALP